VVKIIINNRLFPQHTGKIEQCVTTNGLKGRTMQLNVCLDVVAVDIEGLSTKQSPQYNYLTKNVWYQCLLKATVTRDF
jgi:hypothetical protein